MVSGDDAVGWNASHLPGATVVAMSCVGKAMLTAGADSLVRCVDLSTPWYAEQGADDDNLQQPEPVELTALADYHENPITAIALSLDARVLATGDETSAVRLFDLPHDALPLPDPDTDSSDQPDIKLRQLVAKFGGPVRSLCFSPTGRFLAAVSDEPGLIKYINCSAFSVSVFRSPDNLPETPTFSAVLFDPCGDFLLTLTTRGVPHLWSIDSQNVVSTIAAAGAIAPTTHSPSSAATAAAWNSDGSLLALGLASGKVLVLQRGPTGAEVFQSAPIATLLPPANGRTPITTVAWSPTGGYILAGDVEGQALMWRIDLEKLQTSQEPLEKWNPENDAAAISAVVWIPGQNAFAAVDKAGQWGVVGDVVEPHLPKPAERSVSTRSQPAIPQPKTGRPSDASQGEDTDEEEEVLRSSRRTAIDDMEDDESDHDDRQPLAEDDYDSDRDYYRDLYGSDRKRRGRYTSMQSQLTPKPDPFMPSSTPPGESVTRRMMCWNLVGAMLTTKEETKSTIEIDFADSARRQIRFADHYSYDQGSLSDAGAFFACPPSENHPSCLFYKPHNPWSTNAEWTAKLGQGEDSKLVALGKRFAASFTSQNNIRVFSLTGIETDLFRVAGSPVTMAAELDKLVVVTCLESGQLWYELLQESESGSMDKVLSSGPLPLTPGSSLRWTGFRKETNELVVFDSAGGLQCLIDSRASMRWTILLESASKTAECDTFWLAAVTNASAIGVGCLGSEMYPSIAPRPAFRSIKLCLPLLDKNPKLEALFAHNTEMWRAKSCVAELEHVCGAEDDDLLDAKDDVSDLEVMVDKTILGLMEVACRANQAPRALELFSRLHRMESGRVAHKLANHYRLPVLIQRMELVMKAKQEAEKRRREQEALRCAAPPAVVSYEPSSPAAQSPVTPGPPSLARTEDVVTSGGVPFAHAPKSTVRFDVSPATTVKVQPARGTSEEPEASDDLTEIRPLRVLADKKSKIGSVGSKRPVLANPFALKALKTGRSASPQTTQN